MLGKSEAAIDLDGNRLVAREEDVGWVGQGELYSLHLRIWLMLRIVLRGRERIKSS